MAVSFKAKSGLLRRCLSHKIEAKAGVPSPLNRVPIMHATLRQATARALRAVESPCSIVGNAVLHDRVASDEGNFSCKGNEDIMWDARSIVHRKRNPSHGGYDYCRGGGGSIDLKRASPPRKKLRSSARRRIEDIEEDETVSEERSEDHSTSTCLETV